MSTIKIEFESEDIAAVAAVSALTNSLLGKSVAKAVESVIVTDAEEVKADKPAPKPRPSRAKAKPEPEPEEEEEETQDDDFADTDEEEETEDGDDITEDTLRELSAKKIGKHKEAIIAELAKFKVKGWANLPEKHYAAMHSFLTKLK